MGSEKDTGVRAYFSERIPASHRLGLVRAVNALLRGGITTMEDLCGATDEKIKRLRNIGDKSFEIAAMMRDMYVAEKADEERTFTKS